MTKIRNGMAAIRNAPTTVARFVNPGLTEANLAYADNAEFSTFRTAATPNA